jgi:ABC-type lipoprotein release transport system permease subunit
MDGIWAVARARLRRRWRGLVALGLLAGVVGGMATAAVAGERRTMTVAPRLIAATRAHDVLLTVNTLEPDLEKVEQSKADLLAAIKAQPGVRAVWPAATYIGRTKVSKDWYYPIAGATRRPLYRPILVAGRLPDPAAPDEVALTAQTAANTHLRVGSVIEMDFYAHTESQISEVMKGTELRPAGKENVRLRVVGVLSDPFDIAPAATSRFMLATPAFAKEWGPELLHQPGFAVNLDDGTAGIERFVAGVEKRVEREHGADPTAIRPQTNLDALRSSESAEGVARTTLLLLAGIVALLGAFAVGQATRRHLSLDHGEGRTLEALGFTRRDRVAAVALPGVLAAVVGAGTAVLVAYLLSPIFPLGRPRRLEPDPGLRFDALVVVGGAAITALVVVGTFAVLAGASRRAAPAPGRGRLRWLPLLIAGAPATVVLGTRLAFEPVAGRRVIGTRSAMVGAAVGVVGAVAALTFAGSFHRLVSASPNWGADYHLSIETPSNALAAESSGSDHPQQGILQRSAEIAADPRVEAVAMQASAWIAIDGQPTMSTAISNVRGRIRPVVRTGRVPVGADEIALGPALARRLRVTLGDRVQVRAGGNRASMVVVGTVLDSSSVTPDYADGALVASERLQKLTDDQPDAGYYQVILVRFGPGVDVAAATRAFDRRFPWGIMDESTPAVPPSLQNIADVQAVPVLLAVFFGGLVVLALANGLVVAGRRQRHQFGVVRSMGFTRGQVRATMAAMALSLGGVALALGVPLGLGVGVWVWSALSSQLDVAVTIAWPLLALAVVVPAVLAVAVVASTWPARGANVESAASILRTE